MSIDAQTVSMRHTVLLVDDDERVRSALARILHWISAWQVIGEAADGATALTLAAALLPTLILLDLSLPDVDGLRLISELQAALPGTLIVVLTAEDSPVIRDQALALGIRGYLLKSTPPDQLLDQLRTLLTTGL